MNSCPYFLMIRGCRRVLVASTNRSAPEIGALPVSGVLPDRCMRKVDAPIRASETVGHG